MNVLRAAQNSAFKNHPTDILRDENHDYGIVLVPIIHKTALNTTKHIFNQAASLLLHPTEPYRDINFPLSTLSLSSIIDAKKLFKVLRLHYCTEVPVLHDRSQDHAHSLFYILSIYQSRPHPFYASCICDHKPSSW